MTDAERDDRRRLLDLAEEIRRHQLIKVRRGRELTIEDRALHRRARHIIGQG
jgi:hypothetical protein